jgi:hypothetical protein
MLDDDHDTDLPRGLAGKIVELTGVYRSVESNSV